MNGNPFGGGGGAGPTGPSGPIGPPGATGPGGGGGSDPPDKPVLPPWYGSLNGAPQGWGAAPDHEFLLVGTGRNSLWNNGLSYWNSCRGLRGCGNW